MSLNETDLELLDEKVMEKILKQAKRDELFFLMIIGIMITIAVSVLYITL